MRRLLRWTFHALAAASLLLCVAMAGLWVRSYGVYDVLIADRLEAPKAYRNHRGKDYRCIVLSSPGRFAGWFGWSARPESQPTPP